MYITLSLPYTESKECDLYLDFPYISRNVVFRTISIPAKVDMRIPYMSVNKICDLFNDMVYYVGLSHTLKLFPQNVQTGSMMLVYYDTSNDLNKDIADMLYFLKLAGIYVNKLKYEISKELAEAIEAKDSTILGDFRYDFHINEYPNIGYHVNFGKIYNNLNDKIAYLPIEIKRLFGSKDDLDNSRDVLTAIAAYMSLEVLTLNNRLYIACRTCYKNDPITNEVIYCEKTFRNQFLNMFKYHQQEIIME